MSRTTDAAALRIARQDYREARALLGQVAALMGVEDNDPAALLQAAEMTTIGMNAMCKDWESLAEQIRDMQRKLVDSQRALDDERAFNRVLQRQLAAERARSQDLAAKLGDEA